MFQPPRPIRPIRVDRPVGAPLVRGLVAGRLAQLGVMVQQGLLTPEEFAAAKAELLGRRSGS